MENIISLIQERLTQHFSPDYIRVIDESDKHKGHPGAKEGGGHFCLMIKAKCFDNISLISAHRLIYQALDNLMRTKIHAISIKILKSERK